MQRNSAAVHLSDLAFEAAWLFITHSTLFFSDVLKLIHKLTSRQTLLPE